jgi:hypothetical protein
VVAVEGDAVESAFIGPVETILVDEQVDGCSTHSRWPG